MTKHTTEVVFEGKTKGFTQVGQEAEGLNKLLKRSTSEQAKGMVDLERKTSLVQKGLVALGVKDPMSGLSESAKAYHTQVTSLEGDLVKLAREQIKLTRAMEGVERGTEAYEKLEDELKKVDALNRTATRSIRGMEQAFKAEAKAVREVQQEAKQMQGAFAQGLLQGIGAAPFIQRGPGAVRQAAGQAIGGAVRGGAARAGGMARGFGGAMFTGMGGVARGLSGIPLVGPMMAGQLQTSMGYAGKALEAERGRMELAPYLTTEQFRNIGGLSAKRRGQVRAVGAARAEKEFIEPTIAEQYRIEGYTKLAMETRGEKAAAYRGRTGMTREGLMTPMGLTKEDQSAILSKAMIDAEEKVMGFARTEANLLYKQQREDLGQKEVDRAQRSAFMRESNVTGRLSAAGGQYAGMERIEALRFAGQIAAVGGGGLGDIEQQGLAGRAYAAQTAFGIGPQVSGAFALGGRRGALRGAEGRGGAAMEDAIAAGLEMGLSGSELQEYMQQMAQAMQGWKQTGIPISPQSISAIGGGLAKFGIGGVRGGVISQSLTAGTQRLAKQGPQGAFGIMALKHLGGWTGEGGLEKYWEATSRIQKGPGEGPGQYGMKEVEALFHEAMLAGMARGKGVPGGEQIAAGKITFEAGMREQFGVDFGKEEIDLLQKKFMGGKLTIDEQAKVKRAIGLKAKGETAARKLKTKGLRGLAKEDVPGALKRQVGVAATQLAAGYEVLPAMQKQEKAAALATKVVVDTIKPGLDAFSKMSLMGAEKLKVFSDRLLEATTAAEKMTLVYDVFLGGAE